jgi:hypothetical protein
MKKWIVMLCVAGLLSTANAALLPVANGGFESGLANWTTNLIGPDSTIAVTTESPYEGSFSAKFITNWQSGTGVKAEINQTVTGLSGGASYDFTFQAKGLMGPGGVAWAEIKWFNASNIQVGGTGLINIFAGLSNTTYQQKGGTYVTPAGTASGQVSIRLEGGAMPAYNVLYIDNVVTPEPASLALLGLGGLLLRRRK